MSCVFWSLIGCCQDQDVSEREMNNCVSNDTDEFIEVALKTAPGINHYGNDDLWRFSKTEC